MSFATRILGALLVSLLPASAIASTFYGEFWDAPGGVNSLSEARSVIAGGGPTATFGSSLINYPLSAPPGTVQSASTLLSTFLGSDASSLAGTDSYLDGSVFRFTGYLNLIGGDLEYSVYSDDGFALGIDNDVVLSFSGLRSLSPTTGLLDLGVGVKPFELIYFENGGATGVTFKIGGDYATPVSPVPLPAALPLLIAALGGMAFLRRRRS